MHGETPDFRSESKMIFLFALFVRFVVAFSLQVRLGREDRLEERPDLGLFRGGDLALGGPDRAEVAAGQAERGLEHADVVRVAGPGAVLLDRTEEAQVF